MDLIITIVLGLFGISGVSVYTLYSRYKEDLMIDIRNLLEDCRQFDSWDDRSELKVFSWVEGGRKRTPQKVFIRSA